MDINKMLSELKAERSAIEEAIITIERLAAGRGRRRGRPPAWLAARQKPEKAGDGAEAKGKRSVSPEARARMAAAQKRRWAAARKAEAQAAGR
jgi:hypothetical protein